MPGADPLRLAMHNICNAAQMNLKHSELKVFVDEAKKALVELLLVTQESDHHADRKLARNNQLSGHEHDQYIFNTENQAACHSYIDIQFLDPDAFIGNLCINILPD